MISKFNEESGVLVGHQKRSGFENSTIGRKCEVVSRFEDDLRGVRRIARIQGMVLATIIICGGIVFGLEKGRWLDAATLGAALLVLSAVYTQLLYWRAQQRLLDPAFSIHSPEKLK